MNNDPVRMEGVHYNAATQSFEATVTVFGAEGTRNYACAIEAPISTTYEEAADGLARQARRRYAHRGGLHSKSLSLVSRQRAARKGFNPTEWLHQLMGKPDRHAA
ncbi:MAG: orotidine 5-phosphate decarboxylase [Sulfitobacter sp.]|nr:orotidine 5-phosphate decarboxylase [Sulfitobacter sp.]